MGLFGTPYTKPNRRVSGEIGTGIFRPSTYGKLKKTGGHKSSFFLLFF